MLPKMKRMLKQKDICVLATVSGNQPHCSLMAYIAAADGREIYMMTLRDTKKYKNLTQNPAVSLLIDTREDDVGPQKSRAKALTVNGIFQRVDREKQARIRPGLVYGITEVLAERGINITNLDAKTARVGEKLEYIQLFEVDIPKKLDYEWVQEKLRARGKEMGVEVDLQPRGIFRAMSQI